MSRIGPKDTKPELAIRKLVHSMGYRFRLHVEDLPGKPDLVFPKYRKVIFVHGCFWHGCERCSRSKLPDTNYDFWSVKIGKTKTRDKKKYQELETLGWDYLVIWQCEIKTDYIDQISEKIANFLN
ncbi:MAG TPA: very short patch repair endonuclease [Thermodesulfobacteriota bacterium]|nr:very short patch repair endonuclease [Thermodesulfobacteriota bacterium]